MITKIIIQTQNILNLNQMEGQPTACRAANLSFVILTASYRRWLPLHTSCKGMYTVYVVVCVRVGMFVCLSSNLSLSFRPCSMFSAETSTPWSLRFSNLLFHWTHCSKCGQHSLRLVRSIDRRPHSSFPFWLMRFGTTIPRDGRASYFAKGWDNISSGAVNHYFFHWL